MNRIRTGVTGTALVAAAATVAALVPGASAVSTPESSRAVSSQSAAAPTERASMQIVAGKGTIDSRVFGEFGRRGKVRGTFDAQRFIVKQRETYAVGILHATLRRGDGSLVGRANRQITIPVRNGRVDAAAAAFGESAVAGGSCQILDLVLGPLDLNLLGLKVHLNRIVLHIEADPGPGALLGNLLCAVAGLLDGTGLLEQLRLSNVLNRILSILRV
ncbi:MAG: hypothetical protein ACRDO2_11895 [Nocardioidaceae bacterium]